MKMNVSILRVAVVQGLRQPSPETNEKRTMDGAGVDK